MGCGYGERRLYTLKPSKYRIDYGITIAVLGNLNQRPRMTNLRYLEQSVTAGFPKVTFIMATWSGMVG